MVKRKFAADTGFAAASSSALPPDVKRNELPAAQPRPPLQTRGPGEPAMVDFEAALHTIKLPS